MLFEELICCQKLFPMKISSLIKTTMHELERRMDGRKRQNIEYCILDSLRQGEFFHLKLSLKQKQYKIDIT